MVLKNSALRITRLYLAPYDSGIFPDIDVHHNYVYESWELTHICRSQQSPIWLPTNQRCCPSMVFIYPSYSLSDQI